ncbi:MAG: DUF1156 domain-containing protein [Deltaproteobacteria bacterium]|nr:DUF1156 domain-containing protein [Deltaproteobacteria bacterium]
MSSIAVVKRAIEESFPIVEINRLAVPERNAFKPIYQMHKWFARRASCVFRAILLGAMKPAGTNIMEEFYKDHTNDPDTNGKVILDPFMGGGTTVVEGLRLGCKVIGIDLNPVAWFIVKTEVEPVDIEALKGAFARLAERKVAWSGKSVRETLLDQYKTSCPCCGNEAADIIYNFWVKSAVCTIESCKKEVPLFSDYLIAQKSPSIRYHRDCTCPKCGRTFDWEVEPACLIAEPSLMIANPQDAAGIGRGNKRWAYASKEPVRCPWCSAEVSPQAKQAKRERKKVPLSVLYCPHCATVWQYRGTVPEEVSCPVCKNAYKAQEGNVPDNGKFLCSCGNKDQIINSIRKLPEDQLLPMHPYAIEGYCARCGGDEEDEAEEESDLFEGKRKRAKTKTQPDHPCLLSKNNGKFFKRIAPADLARYKQACEVWEREKERLPYPKSEIPEGYNTNQMTKHHYGYWHQMFNPRQILCLSTLLAAIDKERDQVLKEMLLSAFVAALNNTNLFSRFHRFSYREGKIEGVFSRHEYQPKATPCENNVWGVDAAGYGSFNACSSKVIAGKAFALQPFDWRQGSEKNSLSYADPVSGQAFLEAKSSTTIGISGSVDFVITDPPYAGNVNYSELGDFFYVWLRLALARTYPEFAPELTAKAEEIIENPTRGKTAEDFEQGLTQVFRECHRVLRNGGLLAFTFHHAEGSAWESLLRAVCNAGFEIDSVYPIHGEAESSLHLMDKQAISYDLIHVCKKRAPDTTVTKRSWAGVRQEIRRRAREEIQQIEAGRYGNEPLSPADVNIILIGKCLELYSRHYGAIVDHQDKPVELKEALKEIKNLADQLVSKEKPLPSELEEIDAESRIYFLALCENKEIKSDEVHKATRGILEVNDLLEAGLIVKGRAKRGRTYEVKQPAERFTELMEKLGSNQKPSNLNLFGEADNPGVGNGGCFVDKIHFLLALAEGKENLRPWLERWRGEAPQIRAACEYLAAKRKDWAPLTKKILDLMDVGPLFR